MNITNKISIKNKTYLLVLLSVVVALVLSIVSNNGLNTIRAELDYLVFAAKIERYTNKLIVEEQKYRLNANGSIYNLEVANQAYKNAIQYVDEIYKTLNKVDKLGQSDYVLENIHKTRQSTDEYNRLYLKGVSLLTELNQQANTLLTEGEYITLNIQKYVEAKRVEVKNDMTQKNQGSQG